MEDKPTYTDIESGSNSQRIELEENKKFKTNSIIQAESEKNSNTVFQVDVIENVKKS